MTTEGPNPLREAVAAAAAPAPSAAASAHPGSIDAYKYLKANLLAKLTVGDHYKAHLKAGGESTDLGELNEIIVLHSGDIPPGHTVAAFLTMMVPWDNWEGQISTYLEKNFVRTHRALKFKKGDFDNVAVYCHTGDHVCYVSKTLIEQNSASPSAKGGRRRSRRRRSNRRRRSSRRR